MTDNYVTQMMTATLRAKSLKEVTAIKDGAALLCDGLWEGLEALTFNKATQQNAKDYTGEQMKLIDEQTGIMQEAYRNMCRVYNHAEAREQKLLR